MLLLSLSSCYNRVVPLPPWIPGSPDEEENLSDKEALKGQWNIYEKDPTDPCDLRGRIDIQHTLPRYWIIMDFGDPVLGDPIKSDRTETEDGEFVISFDSFYPGAKIIYRFVDNERNTLGVEVKIGDITGLTYILKRIPSEEEIDMHIVSFKLDDSIASADYTLSDELIAIGAGKAFGKYVLPKLEGPDGKEVEAEYKTEDGSEFTRDSIVNDDITVIVTPSGGA